MKIIQAQLLPLTWSEYRALDAYNWSAFKHALEAASLARYKRENPTDGSQEGRLVHALTLEPATVDGEFVVAPFSDFRTKAAKEWRDAETREVVTQSVMDNCSALAAAIHTNNFGKALLSGAQVESSISAEVEVEPGLVVTVKGRIDFLRDLGNSIIAGDLKTCDSLNAADFAREQVVKWHYAGQAAFYSELLSAATDKPVSEWHWLCGNLKTHDVFPAKASDRLLEVGASIWRKALRNYAVAERDGVWAGSAMNNGVVEIDAPDWYADKFGGED